jgi:two-component system nitrogen regulation sensor histidine kinase GlnL
LNHARDDWLDHLLTAVVRLDGERRVRDLNPAAAELLGGREARVEQALAETGLDAMLDRAAAERRIVSVQDLEWRRPDGESWLDADIVRLPDGGWLLELHDAGLRRRALADRQLGDRRALSRRVVRQLAHEIRNPLAGLRGAAQLLARDEPDPARRELADIVRDEADRLDRLVDELLGPSGTVQLQAGNVHEPVDRVFALLAAEAGAGVRVRRDYDPSLPAVAFDGDRLARALLNLGRNALQAGGGQVVLRTRAARNVTCAGQRHRLAVAVEVADDGAGVPDELTDSLFFPLVTGRSDGSGLGLAIAQEIAGLHGGRIEFDSRPGDTVFRLLLPVAPA